MLGKHGGCFFHYTKNFYTSSVVWRTGSEGDTIVTTSDDGAPLVAERVLAEPTSDQQLLTQIVLALGRGAALPSGVMAVPMTAAH